MSNMEGKVTCNDVNDINDNENVEAEEVDVTITEGITMSKRQMKKLQKQKEIQQKKAERRSAERQKRKNKRAEKLANNEDLGPSKKKLKENTMENSNCKVRVVVDCSFDHLMVDKDIMKLSQQLQYCYSRNRRAFNPMQFYMTSLKSKTLARLEQIGFYKSWDIHRKENSYLDNFKKEEIVYLTSDSPNTLEELTPEKVYIIGGLVDHNHYKGLCYDLAVKNNVGHACLPISNFMRLSSRNVLTVNHVFEILLRFTENKNWKDAFYSVIPKRKILDDSKKDGDVIDSDLQNEQTNEQDNVDENVDETSIIGDDETVDNNDDNGDETEI